MHKIVGFAGQIDSFRGPYLECASFRTLNFTVFHGYNENNDEKVVVTEFDCT